MLGSLLLIDSCLRRRIYPAGPVLAIVCCLFNSCSFTDAVPEQNLVSGGRFETRSPGKGLEGVVIGAPHGRSEPDSDTLARALSKSTGAGLVIAYGFKSRRLSVTQPIVTSSGYSNFSSSSQSGSVFADYKRILRTTAQGEVDFYVGVHRSNETQVADRIEVVSSGVTFEEARAIKGAYRTIRDEITRGRNLPRLSMAIEPLDPLLWRSSGVKHHGVLLIAEKGLNLRIPGFASAPETEAVILARWLAETVRIVRENPLALPRIRVRRTEEGRLELIESRKRVQGVVIGAPHGSFDEYTAEMVNHLSYRTGLAAVIAKGFTPTETGGWRINVNRPTEKTFPSEGFEVHSRRARQTFRDFKELVFAASGGALQLYIDIHQYGAGNEIQIATVGISANQSRRIKAAYEAIRDHALSNHPEVRAATLLIEPLDEIEIGAWPAKAEGMLALAPKALHIELPYHAVLATAPSREVYRSIFAHLLTEITPVLQGRDRFNRTDETESNFH